MSAKNNIEIEKKFLVKELPANLEKYKSHKIKQAYISTFPTLRLRQKDDEYIFTFKGKGEIKKVEFEYPLSEEEFNNLWQKVETKKIEKTRYLIPLDNNLTAELDIYYGELSGFMNVEVEFDSLKQAEEFVAPSWFGDDISNERGYSNAEMSKNGIPVKNRN